MVSIDIGAGQGITQAIATKLGIKGQDLKKISLSTWQNVMTEVNNAQSQIDKHNASNPSDKQKSIFTGGRDVNTINQKSNWQNNFVVQQGSVEINESSWNKIVQLLTGKKADVAPTNNKPEANPVDVNKSPVSLSSDIPDSAKNIDIPASIKKAGTESMLDSIGGKIIERSVNGEKQEIAVVEINGQKVRRAINEDGSLGDSIAATKTFGKNEYISGDFPAETKILERLVDGKKQQIGVYEDENGNKVRKLVTTDPETGKTTLGENLVTVSTMGKNKYVTESKFNADVKTMLGLGADEDIPADLKAEYITIGGESSIVIKKDGKVMDSAQLKSFMADYRANTEGNSAFVEAKAQDPISDMPEINSSPQIYNGNSNAEEVKAHNPISDIPEINSAPKIYDGNSNVKDVASNNHKGETREISSDKVKGSYTLAPSDNGDGYRLDISSIIVNGNGEASSFFEMTNKDGNNIYELSNGLYEFRGIQSSGMSSLQSLMDSASRKLSINNAIYNDLSDKQNSGVELADYEKAFMSKHLEDLNNYGLALDKNGNIINIAKDE